MTTSATHKLLGALWPVSPLTLGGGGIAGIWGETTRQEAVKTVQTAVEEGINLIDVAPMYGRGEAESVVGEALQGRMPEGTHVTSKILLGTQSSSETLAKVRRSIGRSLDCLSSIESTCFSCTRISSQTTTSSQGIWLRISIDGASLKPASTKRSFPRLKLFKERASLALGESRVRACRAPSWTC